MKIATPPFTLSRNRERNRLADSEAITHWPLHWWAEANLTAIADFRYREEPSSLQRFETFLPGVCELRPRIISDARGFFVETYHRAKFAELGIAETFVQDNHSCSSKGTLRGFHYQLRHPQAKLCRVVEGEAFDVAVDIRLGSAHFGKWAAVLLSAKHQNQIYIPAGFAHGFLALTETVQFLYKCSDFYDPSDEHGVLWCDPDLGVSWGVSTPVVSEKDSKYQKLAEIPREFLPRFPGI